MTPEDDENAVEGTRLQRPAVGRESAAGLSEAGRRGSSRGGSRRLGLQIDPTNVAEAIELLEGPSHA